jgi:hypothetical protein
LEAEEDGHGEPVSWAEHTYNRRRRQRALGRLTPVEYELAFIAQAAVAACPARPDAAQAFQWIV